MRQWLQEVVQCTSPDWEIADTTDTLEVALAPTCVGDLEDERSCAPTVAGGFESNPGNSCHEWQEPIDDCTPQEAENEVEWLDECDEISDFLMTLGAGQPQYGPRTLNETNRYTSGVDWQEIFDEHRPVQNEKPAQEARSSFFI